MKDEVKRILALPYARELVRSEDGTWHARVVEFPGRMTEGDSQESALTNLEDAMAGWVEIHLEDGDPIPSPIAIDEFSGKFMVRIPKSLHRDLARRADADGVSLNQYVGISLAQTAYHVEHDDSGEYVVRRGTSMRANALESPELRQSVVQSSLTQTRRLTLIVSAGLTKAHAISGASPR